MFYQSHGTVNEVHFVLQEFLMGLIYEQLKWEFAMPKNPDDRNCMPCLFLQFSAEEDNKTCTKMLQVFSRQVNGSGDSR